MFIIYLIVLLQHAQNFIAEKKSPAAKLLSSIVEMGTSLFSTLETHFSMILDGGRRRCSTKDFLIQEEFQMLCERLHSTVSLLVSPKETNVEENPLRISLYSNKNKVAVQLQLSRRHLFIMIISFVLLLIGCVVVLNLFVVL